MTGILQAILSFFGVQASSSANYIEDVFSTYLYTGNSTTGGTQTITNNIDLSTKGGMVWIKGRSAASDHILTDTARGAGTSATANKAISSNLSAAESLGGTAYDYLSAFNADGFTVTQGGTTTATRGANYNAVTYSSWTFRKQAKFFDVVTFTAAADGSASFTHNLGSTPGAIISKRTNGTSSWAVNHRSLGNTGQYLLLDQPSAQSFYSGFGVASSTQVTYSAGSWIANSQCVAYLFAHDAGGFGAAGTDNVISCGSFSTNGSGAATVTLGYEPQWVLWKAYSGTTGTSDWDMFDNMRGYCVPGASNDKRLQPNSAGAEGTVNVGGPTATGFTVENLNTTSNYIYIAIRRGPMKTPTSGTSVFSTTASSATTGTITSGFPTDLTMSFDRTAGFTTGFYRMFQDRLRGAFYILQTNATDAETNNTSTASFASNTGIVLNGGAVYSSGYVHEQFRRAPGFFDVVCFTGTGSYPFTINHNLGVVPELMIFKARNATQSWYVYTNPLVSPNANWYQNYLVLQTTNATASDTTSFTTSPTSTTIPVASFYSGSGTTYVLYLFATVAGVSKVGSYTGTGTTSVKQVDCGFTGGARFVLIKRTDSTGDWYVWDTARGIVSGNDPYLLLNSTAAEVTTTDWVDTYSLGFELSTASGNNVNINNATYIFLAIA